MATLYDARGNRYAVVSPAQLRDAGLDIPPTAAEAARFSTRWAAAAIEAFCRVDDGQAPATKRHATDGLLVGPFQQAAPFDLLIINTDGSLAERSGNGLTIFAQALMDSGLVQPGALFHLNVHHHGASVDSPVSTQLTSASYGDVDGFWLDMGTPAFGAQAAGASGQLSTTEGSSIASVHALQTVNPAWHSSVFVRIGNPHCVTLLQRPADLPTMDWLRSTGFAVLKAIAFATSKQNGGAGDPCPLGVNLQWAVAIDKQRIQARVFERGEGPTMSSGTSACAVASAMWHTRQVTAGEIEVQMPGGTAPVRLVGNDGRLDQVCLFGVATRLVNG